MKKNVSRRNLKLSTEIVRALDDTKVSSVKGGGGAGSLPMMLTCLSCPATHSCTPGGQM